MAATLSPKVISQIVDLIQSTVTNDRLPGLAVGIVLDQSLVWSEGFGFDDIESRHAFTPQSICRVASITKTFTATAILQLRDVGKLSLDDPLIRHIPEFESAKPTAGPIEGVTIRRMLSHHAGLTTEAPLPCWDVLDFPTHEAVMAALPEMEVVIPQDSAFKYSNVAFGLLGEVVARVSGQSYFDYVNEHILSPLQMDASFFERDENSTARCATGYLPSLYTDELQPAPYVPLNGVSACGQLHSNVEDLAKWISLQFRCGHDNDSSVFAGPTISELHRPQYLEEDWSVGYCLGWRANRFGDRVFHSHGGGIYGFASQILFSKTAKVGAVCLTNRWPYSGMLDVTAAVLGIVVDEFERTQHAASTIDGPQVPNEFKELLGHYVAAPAIPVCVDFRNGSLQFVNPNSSRYSLHAPAVLEAKDANNQFVVRGGRGSGELVTFKRDDNNRWSFELGGFRYRK